MSDAGIARDTPEPPYYAVIFTSRRAFGASADNTAYDRVADRMTALAAEQPGYLGVESTRGADGLGITVSYWRDLESIAAWKANAAHRAAQDAGKSRWYSGYSLRIARVEKAVFL